MRVLVEGGWSANLGDAAMTEGVCQMLLAGGTDVSVDVVDYPVNRGVCVLPAGVGIGPQVHLRTPGARLLNRIRILRRLGRCWEGIMEWVALWSFAIARGGPCYLECEDEKGYGRSLHSVVRRYDALHIVGCGSFCDVFPTCSLPRILLIAAFVASGKPVFLSGQQIGPLTNRRLFNAIGRALRQVSLLGLREGGASLTLTQGMNVPADRVVVMGDDSLPVAECGDERADEMLCELGVRPGEYVAANFRVGSYAGDASSQLDRVAGIMDKTIEEMESPIVFVPISLNKSDSDITSAERIRQRMKRSSQVIIATNIANASDAKGLLRRARCAVGMSYHFCVFALSQGTPTLSVTAGPYYDQKGKGLLNMWPDCVEHAPLESATNGEISFSIKRLCSDPEKRSRIAVMNEQLMKSHHRFYLREYSLLGLRGY